MATAQNGWPAGTAAHIGARPFDVPGPSNVRLVLAPAAAPILLYFAAFWDAEVEDIDVSKQHKIPDDWGGAFRDIRGDSTELSNHAAWAAMDINATQYPRGTSHMSLAKRRKIRKELARLNAISKKVNDGQSILRWGGDYQHSPIDQMHVELADGSTPADVARVMKELQQGSRHIVHLLNVKKALTTKNRWAGAYGVRKTQESLRRRGLLGSYIPGRGGKPTRLAVAKFLNQRHHPETRSIPEMTVPDLQALLGPRIYVVR